MPGYKQARNDFENLEKLAQLTDQVELDSQREELMRDPTKDRAAELYRQAIGLWLNEYEDEFVGKFNVAMIDRMRKRYANYL